jgi:ataxia telangiectasia mutated family protein
MLVKGGNDDLRQDAIMEQVFEQVNEFFAVNEKANVRSMRVRTYKVIPLGPMAGVIEYVRNTIPLMDILSPLHKKYHPKDWRINDATKEMKQAVTRSVSERLESYSRVERNVHPVLRHFFFEKFTSPDEWFQNRSKYSQSSAPVSILGHVLGLGDRHCNNILLDSKSGEVVHIDLGIAFDQVSLFLPNELITRF